jgi:hypothetical protein
VPLRHADAHGEPGARHEVVPLEPADGVPQPVAHVDGPAAGQAVEEHRELLAAVARGEVLPAQRVLQGGGHPDEHRVADLVRVGVVDALEVVDVQQGDGEGAALRRPPVQLRVEGAAVRQTGEPVVRRLVGEPGVALLQRLGPAALGLRLPLGLLDLHARAEQGGAALGLGVAQPHGQRVQLAQRGERGDRVAQRLVRVGEHPEQLGALGGAAERVAHRHARPRLVDRLGQPARVQQHAGADPVQRQLETGRREPREHRAGGLEHRTRGVVVPGEQVGHRRGQPRVDGGAGQARGVGLVDGLQRQAEGPPRRGAGAARVVGREAAAGLHEGAREVGQRDGGAVGIARRQPQPPRLREDARGLRREVRHRRVDGAEDRQHVGGARHVVGLAAQLGGAGEQVHGVLGVAEVVVHEPLARQGARLPHQRAPLPGQVLRANGPLQRPAVLAERVVRDGGVVGEPHLRAARAARDRVGDQVLGPPHAGDGVGVREQRDLVDRGLPVGGRCGCCLSCVARCGRHGPSSRPRSVAGLLCHRAPDLR